METGNKQYFFVEALVVALVVFSAFAIYSNDSEDNNNDLQLTSVTGNVELSTRDSMDAFGLQDFAVGAVASLDLTVSEVVVLDCADCNTTTNGVMISGDIVITELLDQQGRLGRVEGLLNFTHFVTSSGPNLVAEERINFQWIAGDISSSWSMIINHDPPRWLPEYDLETVFIETQQGLESRSGPELLIKTPSDNQRIIHACLPDSFLCRSSSADAVLIAGYNPTRDRVIIDGMTEWRKADLSGYLPEGDLSHIISEVISVGDLAPNYHGYTPTSHGGINNVSTYNFTDDMTRLSPLSAWFNSLGLIAIDFATTGESLVWISNEVGHVYNVIDANGALRLGLSIY